MSCAERCRLRSMIAQASWLQSTSACTLLRRTLPLSSSARNTRVCSSRALEARRALPSGVLSSCATPAIKRPSATCSSTRTRVLRVRSSLATVSCSVALAADSSSVRCATRRSRSSAKRRSLACASCSLATALSWMARPASTTSSVTLDMTTVLTVCQAPASRHSSKIVTALRKATTSVQRRLVRATASSTPIQQLWVMTWS